MLPRRRTLAGMGASARNAAKNRFQQVKDNTRQVNRSGISFKEIKSFKVNKSSSIEMYYSFCRLIGSIWANT